MTMKIEAGKFYRTRDGQKVGPMALNPSPSRERHDFWCAPEALSDGSRAYWFFEGNYWPKGDRRQTKANAGFDLIAEWADTPDLTAITTPFGLLDRDTQEALKAHGGPYEWFSGVSGWAVNEHDPTHWHPAYTIRVKAAPPKPREWWVTGSNCLWATYTEAYNACDRGEKPVQVREVLPE